MGKVLVWLIAVGMLLLVVWRLLEFAFGYPEETDDKKRNEMIREAFKIHQDDFGHIPLHQQALAWAHSNKVSVTQLPNNYMIFKWMSVKAK